jgi:3-deoxy-D-manno-octulosonate 8-phosphate phosphatase KdsC-like HAD superfamily phosphatase
MSTKNIEAFRFDDNEFKPFEMFLESPDGVFFIDIDGVLTDGLVSIDGNGKPVFTYSTYDGHAFPLLKENNVAPILISQRHVSNHSTRANMLRTPVFYANRRKMTKYNIALQILRYLRLVHGSITPVTFAVGNDITDLQLINLVNYPMTVPNAHATLKSYVAKHKRGIIAPHNTKPGVDSFRFLAESVIEIMSDKLSITRAK